MHLKVASASFGYLKQGTGVVDVSDLYVLGLSFHWRSKPAFIDGVGEDVRELAVHMQAFCITLGPKPNSQWLECLLR